MAVTEEQIHHAAMAAVQRSAGEAPGDAARLVEALTEVWTMWEQDWGSASIHGGGRGTAFWQRQDSVLMAIADSPGREWELRAAWTQDGWRFVEVNVDAGPWVWPLDVANDGDEPIVDAFMAGLQFKTPNPLRM